jgi:glycogen debranching enzyme
VSLFAKTVQATGDTAFMQELWPAFQQAMNWLDNHIDTTPHTPTHGFLLPKLLSTSAPQQRRHPNWMDTDASQLLLPHQHGQPTPWRQVDQQQCFELKEPRYPLAYVEVQAYAYEAYKAAEALYRRQGDEAHAANAAHKAATLQQRFNQVFWNPEESYLHRAIGANGTPIDAPGSSALHVLHSGILTKDRAEALARRLTQPRDEAEPGTGNVRNDLLSGLGVRTLSSDHPGFSPVSLHNGTVWPHDTQLGQRGFDTLARHFPRSEPLKVAARELTHQLINMGRATQDGHLGALVSGFDFADADNRFVPYPAVSKPQAWSAGVPNAMVFSNLGLETNGFDKTITLNRPWLPAEIDKVTLRDLKVGSSRATLQVTKPESARGQDTDKLLVQLKQSPFHVPVTLVHRQPTRP